MVFHKGNPNQNFVDYFKFELKDNVAFMTKS